MANKEKMLNVVLVNRHGSLAAMQADTYILKAGEFGIGYDVFPTDKNQRPHVVVKIGTGFDTWINCPSLEDYLNGRIDDVAGDLESEVVRATAAEQALSGRIDALDSSNSTALGELETRLNKKIADDILVETTRASDAEKVLTDDLAAEVSRAKEVEEELLEKLNLLADDGGLNDKLDSIKEIADWIDTHGADFQKLIEDLAAEAKAREEADAALAERATDLEDRATELERVTNVGFKEDGTAKTVTEYIDGVKSVIDSSIADEVKTLNDRVTTEVGTLNTTITEKEAALDKRVSANENLLSGMGTHEGGAKLTVVEYVKQVAKDPTSLPVASANGTTAGIVKGSTTSTDALGNQYKEIEVADDGALSIGALSTDKIVQGSDTLILNGGLVEANGGVAI